MRAFLAAVVTLVVVAVASVFVLDAVQKPVSVAYSTQAVRL